MMEKEPGSAWDCPSDTHDTASNRYRGSPSLTKWCPDCEHELRITLESLLKRAEAEVKRLQAETAEIDRVHGANIRHERTQAELLAMLARLAAPVPYTFHDGVKERTVGICPICEDEVVPDAAIGCRREECPGFDARALLARLTAAPPSAPPDGEAAPSPPPEGPPERSRR